MPSQLTAPSVGYIGEALLANFREGVTNTAAKRFRVNDLVTLASGLVEGMGDPTSNATFNGTPDILGMVCRNHQTRTVAEASPGTLPVVLANDVNLFVLPLYSATAANTYPSANLPGAFFRVGFQTSIQMADVATKQTTVTGGVQLQLVGYAEGTNASETFPFGIFRVITAERIFV